MLLLKNTQQIFLSESASWNKLNTYFVTPQLLISFQSADQPIPF